MTSLGLLSGNRGFRLLWFGTVVSFLGDWLTTVATLTIAKDLQDTSLAVAAVLITKTLPIFLVSPWAGPLADRVDRRLLLVGTDLIRAVLVLVMGACYLAGSFWAVLLVLTLRTMVGGVFIPARTAAIPDLTTERELPVAMALSGGTWSVMLALGAALGGVITQYMGILGALAADALTFLISAAFLWGLPALPPGEPDEVGGTGFVDGLRYLRGRVYLPVLLLQKAWLSLAGASLVVLPLYAGGLYVGYAGPLWLGMLYAARGVGALLGSMGIRKLTGDAPGTMRRAILPAYASMALAYVGMALAPTYPLATAMFALGMIGSGAIWTFSGTLAQLATERQVRGRLFSLEFGLSMLVSAATSLVTGAALDAGTSPRTVLLVTGALHVLPMGLWAWVLFAAPDVPGADERLPG